MTQSVSGIGVSRGIAIGRVRRLGGIEPEVQERTVPPAETESEVHRFHRALEIAAQELREVRNAIPEATPPDVAEFIDAHLLMLGDALLSEVPVKLIREHGYRAEWALKLQRDELVSVFDQMADPYLRTRRDDIEHVIHRVQRILLDQGGTPALDGFKDTVVIAAELSPADLVTLHQHGIAGYVTEGGGPLSHTAILARSLGIPAVAGAHGALQLVHEDQPVIIDGGSGLVLIEPPLETLREYRRRHREQRARLRRLAVTKGIPAISVDGVEIGLLANIELEEDFRLLRRYGAGGVGLYRTEFLYLDRAQPASEEEQLALFRRVLRTLRGKPLTIRTLDLGSDKECTPQHPISPAPNPALGLRAIRRCLKDVEVFKPQLRAILRAGAYGPIRLLFPMLTTIGELLEALELVEECRTELRRERRRYRGDIPIGGMIEVPAAALSAPAFARRLDFMSIGTNDLIQYTLAIDRLDDEVNYLYDPLHPAVLHLIQTTLDAGRAARVPVSMCGEMAGDICYTRLLLGMGLREFSMPPARIPEIKQVVLQSHVGRLTGQCQEILSSSDPLEIAAGVEALNADLNPEL